MEADDEARQQDGCQNATSDAVANVLSVGRLCCRDNIAGSVSLPQVNNWFTISLQRNQSIYGYFALLFGVNLPLIGPIVDASTEVLQVLAQIFMILAYAEQWILWILTNVITIAMWIIVMIADPASVSWSAPTLIMWIAYLINAGYGYYNWRKGAISEAVSV